MDEITKYAAQLAAKDAQEIHKGNIDELKEQAIVFIKKVNFIINGYSPIEQSINSTAANIAKVYSSMKKQNYLTSQLIQAQYNFEEKLNNFLGRKIHFVWVNDKNGEVYFQDESKAAKIYSKVSSARRGSAAIKIDPNDLIKKPTMLEENIQKLISRRQLAYQYVYNTAIARWDQNADKKNRWYKSHYKQFYWENEGATSKDEKWGWSYTKINRGNIAEAYINMIMNQQKQFKLAMGSIEKRLEAYDLYMQSHNILNNKAGISEGDVILQFQNVQEGTVQFAIKFGRPDTAKIGPYIYAAYKIIDLAEEIKDLENADPVIKIQQLLDKMSLSSRFRLNILTSGEKELREKVDKIVKETVL